MEAVADFAYAIDKALAKRLRAEGRRYSNFIYDGGLRYKIDLLNADPIFIEVVDHKNIVCVTRGEKSYRFSCVDSTSMSEIADTVLCPVEKDEEEKGQEDYGYAVYQEFCKRLQAKGCKFGALAPDIHTFLIKVEGFDKDICIDGSSSRNVRVSWQGMERFYARIGTKPSSVVNEFLFGTVLADGSVDAKDFGLRAFKEIRARLKAKGVWHVDVSIPGGRIYIAEFAGQDKTPLRVEIEEDGDILVSYLKKDVAFPYNKLVDLTPADVADVMMGKTTPPFPEETTPLSEAKTPENAIDIIFNYFCKVLESRGVKVLVNKTPQPGDSGRFYLASFIPEYKDQDKLDFYCHSGSITIHLTPFVYFEFEAIKKASCKDLFTLVFGRDD
jgi:hypothetical protein